MQPPRDRRPYRLLDVEELHAQSPRTFFIPSPAVRAGLRPGDVVQLIFESLLDAAVPRERMWVAVRQVEAAGYVGGLDTPPDHVGGLRVGDPVEFGPEHVAVVWDGTAGPPKKAVVSLRSHAHDLRPEYVYRNPPCAEEDSGWCCLVGDESEEERGDVDAMLLQAVDFLVARWPELAPVFADPDEQSEWEWRPETGQYVRIA